MEVATWPKKITKHIFLIEWNEWGEHRALSPSKRKTINHSIINEQTNEYRSKHR